MSLQLVELVPVDTTPDGVEGLLERVADAATTAGGEVIEAQVTADGRQAFVIVAGAGGDALREALRGADLPATSVEPVRLVGAELEDLKAARPGGRYLVEWDLPAGLTMDAYLARKKEKSPLYAKVPEATFLRTYVREDLDKCLCFYDADDEGAVLKARDAVGAPVDRLYELGPGARPCA